MVMEAYFDILEQTQLFHNIQTSDLKPMLNCIQAVVKTYKKGEYIHLEHEMLSDIGIVLSGSVHMLKEDIWGNTTILTKIEPKQLLGETFACGSNPITTVSFYAAQNTTVLFLPFQRVMHTCSNSCAFHHHLIQNMVSLIADKNRDLMEKVEVVSKKSLREKILAYLHLQAKKQGAAYFEIPLGRVELADYLCSDRSALTRELNKLREENILDFDKNMFRLLEK